jgi:hypothetical protein
MPPAVNAIATTPARSFMPVKSNCTALSAAPLLPVAAGELWEPEPPGAVADEIADEMLDATLDKALLTLLAADSPADDKDSLSEEAAEEALEVTLAAEPDALEPPAPPMTPTPGMEVAVNGAVATMVVPEKVTVITPLETGSAAGGRLLADWATVKGVPEEADRPLSEVSRML